MPQLDKQHYKKLVEHMNEAVWVGDEHECTVYANPKFCKMLGYKLSEIIGWESYDFWDEESAKRVKGVNNSDRKKGVSSSYEGTLVTKKGKKIPVLLSGSPLSDGGTIGIMTDLRELKKNESLYKKLVEHMNEGVMVTDKKSHIMYINDTFSKMSGYSPQELIGKLSSKMWDKEGAKKVREINKTERKKGLRSSYELNLLTKEEKKIPVLISGSPLPGGGTIGIITDLTTIKQKEETEKVLSSALQYSTDAIILFDAKGVIESWNKGAKIMFGYKKEDIIGKSLKTIFGANDLEGILKESDVIYNFEFTGLHKNASPLSVSATLTPLFINARSKKRKVSSWLMIARDISHQAKFEEELALKYQKMKEAYTQFGILRRQMDYLIELVELCASYKDKKMVADYIVSSIIMLTKADACVLRHFNEKKNTLDLISSFGVGDDWKGKSSIKFNKSIVEKAFDAGNPLKIIDISKETRYQSVFLARKNNLCSLLLIPLIFRGELVGSLSLYASPEKKLEIFENEFIEQYAKLIEIILGAMF